jgi:hypothetical protein
LESQRGEKSQNALLALSFTSTFLSPAFFQLFWQRKHFNFSLPAFFIFA